MQIFWQGYTSIRIETKQGDKAGELVTDPFENESAIRFPRTVEPEMVVLSNQERKDFNLEGVAGKPFIVSDPGEYEVRGIFAYGIQDPIADAGEKRPVVYRIEAEDISIGFLGKLNRKLTDVELEHLGNIDILVLPVGGGDGMDAKTAAAVVNMIEPRIVIPINYQIPGIKAKLDSVDAFCKATGGKRQDGNRLKISKKELPADDTLIMVIERS
ncbi:MAG: MBL fold metallo-hydrolase [Patescibacteria group bacterium]|jgi:hypothetical protein